MTKITEQTLIPISLISTMIGGIMWLTTIYNTAQANKESIENMEATRVRIWVQLREMNLRLGRIEGAVGIEDPVGKP